MPSIDERIVSMAFDNKKFEAGVAQTMATLAKLNESLKLTGAAKGLVDIQAASSKITLTEAGRAADVLKGKMEFAGAVKGLNEVQAAGKKINLDSAGKSADGLKGKFQAAFSAISTAASRINFSGITTAIDKVKSIFNFGKSADVAFSQIEASSSKVRLTGITDAISSVSNGFSVLQGAASVALGSIAAQAAQAGAGMLKSLSLGPLIGGFKEYGTNLNSIQTILANTQAEGAKLKDVKDALGDLNTYSDKTIYNFGQMARNIGTFTAAGVDLKTSVEAIKGIANLAALSGSNSDQASTAMYQLSQAIANGKVNLQDWNSVVNAGMGGEVFQKALFDTGKAMGTITNSPVGQTFDEWKKSGESFRASLSETQKKATSGTKELKLAQQDAAKTISDAQSAAADAVENASQRVKDAEEGVGEAARQAANDVRDAVKAQSDTVKQSALDVKNALDTVREARKRLALAMKPPSADELQAATDALTTAQLDQSDLSTAVTDAQQEQTRSAEDLATAQAKLAALQKSGATASEIQSASRAVEDATKRVADAADAQTRALLQQNSAVRDVNQAEKDLQATRDKGTKKDSNVKDARDALTQATKNYKDTQIKAQEDVAKAAVHVADVQRASAKSQIAAGERLADATKAQAKIIVDSQESISNARVNAAKSLRAAKDALLDKGPDLTWLTSKVLTSTLKQFTGDMTDAQLKAQGFTDAQIKSIQATAKTAKDAATKVKELGQVFQVALESMGSGWATTFQTIFGDFTEAKKTFTGLSTFFGGFINASSKARNAVLKDWKALGGRTVLIDAIKKSFEALVAIIKPIHDAFREIFPPKTGKDLFDLTVKFRDFMENLKIGPETADKLRRTFAGFFAILDIGKHIVGRIISVIGKLLGVASGGSGGFLEFTATVGDFFVKMDRAIESGEGFSAFFENLPGLLSAPITLLKQVTTAIGKLFGIDSDTSGMDKAKGGIKGLKDSLGPLKTVLDFVLGAWKDFMGFMGGIVDKLSPIISGIGHAFSTIGDAIADGLKGIKFEDVLKVLQTGLLAALLISIKRIFGKGLNVNVGGGLIDKLKASLDTLTGSLKAMTLQLKAKTLLEIAAAIALLAASVTVLAKIDPKNLAKSMTAIAVGLGELVVAMAILTKIGGAGAFVTLPFIAGSMVLLAGALVILAGAIKLMSKMNWDELGRGLAGVAGALVAIGIGVEAIPPSIIIVGPALIPLAAALVIIAGAIKIFATMKWEDIAKGLVGIGGALVVIGLAMSTLSGPQILLIGPGLILVAIALNGLAGAVAAFGHMSTDTLVTGLLGIGAALLIIGTAMWAFPPFLPITAAGLILVSIALAGIAAAVGLMGGMKTSTIVKGLIGIGGALIVLAIGLTAMAATLPGSAGLLAAATGLAILVPTLALMGSMKWSTIAKGLAVAAAAMLVIGTAGIIAGPGLMIVGLGLITIGVGIAGVGAGMFLLAKALSILSDDGKKSLALMITTFTAFVALIPTLILQFVKGLVDTVASIVKLAPLIVDSLAKIIISVVTLIGKIAVPLALAIGQLLDIVLVVIAQYALPIINAGIDLLAKFLSGIASHISDITTTVATIVIGFLDAITAKLGDIVEAGLNTLVHFLKGIIDGAPRVVATVATLIGTFIDSVAAALPRLIASGAHLLVSFLKGISDHIQSVIDAGGDLIIKILIGINNQKNKVIKAAATMIGDFLQAAAEAMVSLAGRVATIIVNFLNGMAKAIRDHSHEINKAGIDVASALVEGLVDGLSQLADKLNAVAGGVVKGMLKKILGILGIHSPSTVFQSIGENSMLGLAGGLTSGGDAANKAAGDAGTGIVKTMSSSLSKIPTFLDKVIVAEPVITPVLDLTNVKSGAKEIGPILSSGSVLDLAPMAEKTRQESGLVFATASSDPWGVGTDHPANALHPQAPVKGAGPLLVQNNYSPKALSPSEVYRLTRTQLAHARLLLEGKGG